MGYTFGISFVVFDTDESYLQGISDIKSYELDGLYYIVAASEADSTVTVFGLSDPSAPEIISTIEYDANSGTFVASDLTFVETGTETRILVMGRYDDNFTFYDIETDGTLTFGDAITDGSAAYQRGWVGESVVIGNRTFVYTASFGQEKLNQFEVNASGTLDFIRDYSGFSGNRIWEVSEAEYGFLHGTHMLAVSNAHDDSVLLYRLRFDGRLRQTDKFGEDDEGGVSAITAIGYAQAEGRAFVLIANSMADSISVLRVSEHGIFNLVDTFYDTRDTRFGGVTAMEVVEYSGRVFVFAGGADDGITVLELNYRGQLRHLATIEDDFDTTLQNVSSIDVRMIGDVAHILVGSLADHGITELTLDLARDGSDIRGGTGDDILVGTSGDDVIWGMGHKDTLYGGDGDDRLIDGRGKDVLYGGGGADIFEFTEDGKSDFIEDFEIGIDRIDLSDWDNLYHISSLTIGSRANGAVIFVGDDIIRVRSVDGQPIDVDLFTQDSFIFG